MAAAVTRHVHNPSWDKPALAKARQDVVDLFTTRFGYRLVSGLGLDPKREDVVRELSELCSPIAPDPISEHDMLAVYVTCHGFVFDGTGEHLLITSDTHPDHLGGALSTAELATCVLRGTRVRRLLLILDTCQAGHGGNEIASRALDKQTERWGSERNPGLVVIYSAWPTEQAAAGLFPRLLRDAVDALSTAGRAPEMLQVGALVDHMQRHPERPGYQKLGWWGGAMTGLEPPFLSNPRHNPAFNGVDLAIQQAVERRARATNQDTVFRETVVRRAMGSHDAPAAGWWFTGRHTALRALTDWLTHPDPARPLQVVTGDPGSGKSAVLGLLATLTDPDRRGTVPIHSLGLPDTAVPPAGVIDARLTAQQLTTEQVLHALAAAAEVDVTTPEELVERLGDREGVAPFTVLLDGVDEAAAPQDLAGTLLGPLVRQAEGRLRLLIGTRPRILPSLAPGLRRQDLDTVIDLDADQYADPGAMTIYVIRNLRDAVAESTYRDQPREYRRDVAQAVVESARRSFLVARIIATTLASQPIVADPYDPAWRRSLPSVPGEAMQRDLETRLGDETQRARDLLVPLAFAQGKGLPWEDIWAPLASLVSGRDYTDDDVLWLRDHAGSYIVENVDAGRSAYRLYHHALAEHLRGGVDARHVHDAFVTILLARVPLSSDARTDWTQAHPYIRTHLATHAAGAGRVDEIITDPEYLVYADPDTLLPALHHTTGASPRTRPIYRNNSHRTLSPRQRRLTLAIDATRFGDVPFASELAHNLEWRPRWATGRRTSAALRTALRTQDNIVACIHLDDQPLAITASRYGGGHVSIWDLADGVFLYALADDAEAVACTYIDDRPVAVTGGRDGNVRIWDLSDRTLRATLAGHTGLVDSIACALIDGRPFAATSSDHDETVRLWDLANGELHATISGYTDPVTRLAFTEVDGRPVVILGDEGGLVSVWDLIDNTLRATLTEDTNWVTDIACTDMDDRRIAVIATTDFGTIYVGGFNGEGGTVRVWDLTDGTLLYTLPGKARTAACGRIEGRPVVVTGGEDGNVRVWDLADGTLLTTLTGHAGLVSEVTCTHINDRPVAVSLGPRNSLRVWDLSQNDVIRDQETVAANIWTIACTQIREGSVAVTGNHDGTVGVWDLVHGTSRTLSGDAGRETVMAVACISLDDRPIAVAIHSSLSDFIGVRVWDLTDETPPATLNYERSHIAAVACTHINGRPVAVVGIHDRLQVWDLTDRTLRATLTSGDGGMWVMACAHNEGRPLAATGHYDGTVQIWDLTDGTLHATLTGHTEGVWAAAWAHLDGDLVAISWARDGTICVWDPADSTLRATFTGHSSRGTAVASIDDRALVVTAHDDGAVVTTDLRTGLTETLFVQNPVMALATGPDGEIVVSTGADLVVTHKVRD